MPTMFENAAKTWRVWRARRWILSRDKAELLALITAPDTGLDQQDLDGLVQLAFNSYADGQRDAIINRIAEHLR